MAREDHAGTDYSDDEQLPDDQGNGFDVLRQRQVIHRRLGSRPAC